MNPGSAGMMSESFFPSPMADLASRPLVDNPFGAISKAAVPAFDPLNLGIKDSGMHGSLCALRRLLQGADKVLKEWTHEVGPSGYPATYNGLAVAPGINITGGLVTCIDAAIQPHHQQQEHQQQKDSSSGGAASPEARTQPHTASTPAESASDTFDSSTKSLRSAQPDFLSQLLQRLPVLVQTLFDISGNPPSASNSTGPLDASIGLEHGNASMADLLRFVTASSVYLFVIAVLCLCKHVHCQ